jgi:hypothetical protein
VLVAALQVLQTANHKLARRTLPDHVARRHRVGGAVIVPEADPVGVGVQGQSRSALIWRSRRAELFPVIRYFVGNPLPCCWYFVITPDASASGVRTLAMAGPPVPGQGLPRCQRTTGFGTAIALRGRPKDCIGDAMALAKPASAYAGVRL